MEGKLQLGYNLWETDLSSINEKYKKYFEEKVVQNLWNIHSLFKILKLTVSQLWSPDTYFFMINVTEYIVKYFIPRGRTKAEWQQ